MIFLCVDGYTSIRSAIRVSAGNGGRNFALVSRQELSLFDNDFINSHNHVELIILPFIGFAPTGNGHFRCIYSIIFALLSFFSILNKISIHHRKDVICVSDKKRCALSIYLYLLIFKDFKFFSHNEFGHANKMKFREIGYVFTTSTTITSSQACPDIANNDSYKLVLLPKFTVNEEYTLKLIKEFLDVICKMGLPIFISLHPKIRRLSYELENDPRIELLTIGHANEIAKGRGIAVIWHGTSAEFFSDTKWEKYLYWHESFLQISPEGNRYPDIKSIQNVHDFAISCSEGFNTNELH